MNELARRTTLPPRLLEQLAEYARNSRAPNTRRAYAAQWRLFEVWCVRMGQDCLPATPLAVAAYLAERASCGASVATLSVALAAVAFVHHAAGKPFDRRHPGLNLVLAGIRRRHTAPQR